MPSPEKLEQALHDFAVGDDITTKIYAGFEGITTKTAKTKKAAFFRQALSVMNASLPPEQVKAIFETCACCKSGIRDRNSKKFAAENRHLSLKARLEVISMQAWMNMGTAHLDEEGFLIVQAVSYRPGENFECACSAISHTDHICRVPKEYCYCCGGHFKYHYEIMLDVNLETAGIISSPLATDGERPCVFKYRIVE